jgi:hypothetical protein
MLTTHEWAASDKMRRSYELFARYVVPHFRGHTQGYRDEWRRIQEAVKDRGIVGESIGRSANSTFKDGARS